MSQTVSMSVGRVAIMHDIRAEYSANVDKSLSYRNTTFIDKLRDFNYDIERYTNARFQHAIDEYNERQTRDCRKKTQPYTQIIANENEKLLAKVEYNRAHGINTSVRRPIQLVHEYVLQVGDRNTNSSITADIDKNREYAKSVLEEFQKKYPHVEILLATFHADEPNGTPHLHILVQYVGNEYKQGLSEQISISKALEQDGFERSQNRGNYAINRFVEDVKDTIMTDKLSEIMHEERDIIGEHRKHEATAIFREKARIEEKHIKEVGAIQMNKIQTAHQNLETKRNEYQQYYSSVADSLNKGIEKLNVDRNALESQKTKFEAYKQTREKSLQDKETYLDAFANRTSELFCEAKEYLDKSKKIYSLLNNERKELYEAPLVKLDENLLAYQRKKQRSLSL